MINILIIEDNVDIRENLTEMLEIAGYKVISAPDGQKGVRLATETIPHIILSDIMMPHLDGNGVFEVLRNQDSTKHIPFIFVTSSVEKRVIQSALDKGANGYIKKPFEEKELLSVIESCLKAHS